MSQQQTVEERDESVQTSLDGFQKPFGIPAHGEDEIAAEAGKVLNLQPNRLRALTPLECAEGAFVLGQYAHRIQVAVNREQARARWADESIRRVIAKTVNSYKGWSFEERRTQAVQDNDAARKLDEIRVGCQLRIDRLSFLANKAESMAKTMLSLKNTKRGTGENE